MLETVRLDLVPHYFDRVLESVYSEWGNNNINFWRSWIKSSMSPVGIPSTYVVLLDKEYVGTFSFWTCDLQSRQDLSPWLGGIVVVPEFRGRGFGLYIQESAKKLLSLQGVHTAYLFTELVGFYEKTGWQYVEDIYDETDKEVHLYKLCL